MIHKTGYFTFSCKVAHLEPGAARLSFLVMCTNRAWEKPSNAQGTCRPDSGKVWSTRIHGCTFSCLRIPLSPSSLLSPLVFVVSLEKRHGGCSGPASGGHAAITALQRKICLLFVVPCQCKAVHEKTASVCPCRYSLWWGSQPELGKPEEMENQGGLCQGS